MQDQPHKESSLKNVNVQISVTVFLAIVVLSGYFIVSSYNNSIANEERNVKERLKSITATMALQLDGDLHEALYRKYPNKGDISSNAQDSDYHRLHQILLAGKMANGLESELYTAVWEPETKQFMGGITSADKPFFRHSYESYPDEVIEQYYKGGSLPVYEDEFDTWLSAFTPLRNSNGDVVAIVQTDVTLTDFMNKAQRKLLNNVLISIIVLILIAGVMFVSLRTILKRDRKAKADLLASKLVIQEKQHELIESINYAKRIQEAILPSNAILAEHLGEGFVLYMPKDIVAGDFYWFEHTDNRVLFAAADCTGHGVPGAMVSVMCSNALNTSVREDQLTEPAAILERAVVYLEGRFDKSDLHVNDGMDVALCSLDRTTKELQYAGANNPLWVIPKGAQTIEEIIEIKGDKQPVGHYEHRKPFTNHTVTLNDGDQIYLFSDGFVDQFGGDKGKKFKSKPFKQLLLDTLSESMNAQQDALQQSFNQWRGAHDQIDDVCVIGVRV